MDLSETLWSHWHDFLSQDVTEVAWWNGAHISLTLSESVIKWAVSGIGKNIRVVSECESTVEVKDNISIDILEEVSMRFFQVDEAKTLVNIHL